MIIASFLRALGQLDDPRFRRVLFLGILASLLLLIAATAAVVWLVQALAGDTAQLPWIGEVTWVDNILSWGSVLLMLGLSVVLMMPVASAIISMLLEDVAEAVEARHYPQLPRVPRIGFFDGLLDALSFLGVLIVANILALVLYLLFAPVALFIFWGLNGFLLGREYFTLAAMRRVGRQRAQDLRRRHLGTIWLAGTLMAIPLSIPLVNLLIPILGAATFTHIFHGLTGVSARGRKS